VKIGLQFDAGFFRRVRTCILILMIPKLVMICWSVAFLVGATNEKRPPDAIVIGAGISGLSAALEAACYGARVIVVDQSTIGGGHAILSNGAVCIVNTPLQAAQKIQDGPELAQRDFLSRGEDAHRDWVARYVQESKDQLYDWFTDLGVQFDFLVKPAGNSVPRLHLARGKGWGLVGPLFQRCLRHPLIQFVWATRVDDLIVHNGRVRGARVRDLRSGKVSTLRARNVIVATGGFGSNLSMVLKHWPVGEPKPERLLLGAAHTATGSGHDFVLRAGGTLERMDHQWNYVLGLPDPRDATGARGLAAFNFNGIWVNQDGRRFTQEFGDPKAILASLLRQPRATYWTVFDDKGKNGFSITLAGWDNFRDVAKIVYDTAGATLQANSLADLATKMGVPARTLQETVDRFNELTREGLDRDFQAFGPKTSPKPKPIDSPPFYAARFFPITRKSMGGVSVDFQCRVLTPAQMPIPNLFAVGEVTGFAGINGKAALEGTFLGPAAFMGRIAGRAVAQNAKALSSHELRPVPAPSALKDFRNDVCLSCHPVAVQITKKRSGHWHYEQSHQKVLDREYRCAQCHSEMYPYSAKHHKLDHLAQTLQCATCHGVQGNTASSEP
jgi:uncharacterized protein